MRLGDLRPLFNKFGKVMTVRKKVFIDIEFTDFIDPHLISIGLVTEAGEEFYAEVPYPRAKCSEFVVDTVIPLLRNNPDDFCTLDALAPRLASWLEMVKEEGRDLEICFDYGTDWDLFVSAFRRHIPAYIRARNVVSNVDHALCCEWHESTGLPEHHALYDARALRHGYCDLPPVTSAKIIW